MYLSPQYKQNQVKNWNHKTNPFITVCGVGGWVKDSSQSTTYTQIYDQDLSQNMAIFVNNTHKIPIWVALRHPWKTEALSYKYIGLWIPIQVAQVGKF